MKHITLLYINSSFHFIFHFLFHLILHYWSIYCDAGCSFLVEQASQGTARRTRLTWTCSHSTHLGIVQKPMFKIYKHGDT